MSIDSRIYMIVPRASSFKWVGRRGEVEGRILSKVRTAPVKEHWMPLAVNWLAETEGRAESDFPLFHPIVRCISNRASACLSEFLEGNVEILELNGLDGRYMGIHCINWIEGAVLRVDAEDYHSTLRVPLLSAERALNHNIFGDSTVITKLFVSNRVRERIIENNLTGLDFFPVPLST